MRNTVIDMRRVKKLRISLRSVIRGIPTSKRIFVPDEIVVYKQSKVNDSIGYMAFNLPITPRIIEYKGTIMKTFEANFVLKGYETWDMVWHEDEGFVTIQRLINREFIPLSTGLTRDSLELLGQVYLVYKNKFSYMDELIEFMTNCLCVLLLTPEKIMEHIRIGLKKIQVANKERSELGKPIRVKSRVTLGTGDELSIKAVPLIPPMLPNKTVGTDIKNWVLLFDFCEPEVGNMGFGKSSYTYMCMSDLFILRTTRRSINLGGSLFSLKALLYSML